MDNGTLSGSPCDSFHLAAGTPHPERYGAQGATCWVAPRHPR